MERTKGVFKCVLLTIGVIALACPDVEAQQTGRDPNRIRTVVIDAGHGGKDPGALGTGRYRTTEKHVALNVAVLVGGYIKESYPDVKVIYTRSEDKFVELMERSMIANRAKADLFISIHCNSNDNKAACGSETYVMGLHKTEANMKVAQKENSAILLEEGHELRYDGYDPKDPESIIALSLRQNVHLDQGLLFSSLVQKQFKERVGRQDRGVKQAGFLVISYTALPAVLIELGFLSNPAEEDFLQSSNGQDYMASGIYRAFKEYKSMMEGVGDGGTPLVVQQERSAPIDDPAKGTEGGAGDGAVRFKVQIATSSRSVDTAPRNFNGLEGVEEQQGAGLYKYTVGAERTLEQARALQQRCRDLGYDGAFIVAFKEGERIDLQEAVKLARAR